MNKTKLTYILAAILLCCSIWAPNASAASEAEKATAIQAGLAHLYAIQNANGSWASGYYDANTGAAVFAFISQKTFWPADTAGSCVPATATPPTCTSTAYKAAVDKGIQYLLGDGLTTPVSINGAGVNICPGGSGTCTAVYWAGQGEPTYSSGFVSSAIIGYATLFGGGASATVPNVSGSVLNGKTWGFIAQGIVNAFAAGQVTPTQSSGYAGGWHYNIFNNSDADMSTTQWGVISTGYAESLGAVAPNVVRTYLKNGFLPYTQAASGAGCYYPGTYCDQSNTGGWLTSMAFVGSANNTATQNAMAWLSAHWNVNNSSTWLGLFHDAYAMWAVYKGLESNIGLQDNSHIAGASLRTNCAGGANGVAATAGKLPGSGVCNWYEDMNEYLVRAQDADGSWTTDGSGTNWPDPLNTSLFVNILGATPLPASITTGGSTTPTPIPTPALSTVALAALGLLLFGYAAKTLRKRSV